VAVVAETLGLVVLPARPLVVVICYPAQEGSGAGPSVGDAARPCSVLGGKCAFLRAAVCGRLGGDASPAVEPADVEALLELTVDRASWRRTAGPGRAGGREHAVAPRSYVLGVLADAGAAGRSGQPPDGDGQRGEL